MLFVFMLCLGLLTHSLFISNILLHHAESIQSVGFPFFMLTPFINGKVVCSLEKLHLQITIIMFRFDSIVFFSHLFFFSFYPNCFFMPFN